RSTRRAVNALRLPRGQETRRASTRAPARRAPGRPAGWKSFHTGEGARLDLVPDAHLAGLGGRVLVLAEIFLRERIDMRARPLLGGTRDAAADLQVAVRVVGIHDRQRHRRVRLQVARLDPALGGVHANDLAVVVE